MSLPLPVVSRPGSLNISDSNVFAPGREARAAAFARRVFRCPELRALQFDPAHASATLYFQHGPAMKGDAVVRRMADAAADAAPSHDIDLPPWRPGEPVTLHRYGGLISSVEVLSLGGHRLAVRHPAIKREPGTARRIEDVLRATCYISDVVLSLRASILTVRFDPALASSRALLRLIEATLIPVPDVPEAPDTDLPGFTLPYVALAVSAAAEFAAPVLLPAAAALLVLTNIGTIRAAVAQLRTGRLGLPVLHSTIIVLSLFTGSFFSGAVLLWSLRLWQRQHERDVARENAALLADIYRIPEQAWLAVAEEGVERLVRSDRIELGQRIRVLAGEVIPADGEVVAGIALVEEGIAGGVLATRARADEVLAGGRVRAGQLDMAVLRLGSRTKVAQLAQALISSTVPVPSRWALTPEAEKFADKTVLPSLLLAVAGLLTGGPRTANAVLRPDYATGVGLADSLRRLRVTRIALQNGALVRTRDALRRLAAATWVMLDDYEGLGEAECELADIEFRQISETQLLQAAAAAGAWLGDARGPALARACAERGLIVRKAELRHFEETGITVSVGRHVIRLLGRGERARLPPLRVEVDGAKVAELRFRPSDHVPAAATVKQLQRSGLRVFLASARAPAEAARVARLIGADAHAGLLDGPTKSRLIRGLNELGIALLHVREGAALPHAHRNYVSVSLAGPGGLGDGDITLLGRSISRLPELHALARDSAARSQKDRWTVLAPNLAGVAGVFLFGLTSLSLVMISNLATYLARNRARRDLERTKTSPLDELYLRSLAPERTGLTAPAVLTETVGTDQAGQRGPEQKGEALPFSRDTPMLPPSTTVAKPDVLPDPETLDLIHKIESFPSDLGWLLMGVGALGLVLPGLAGFPFLIAGATVITPGGPKRLARWIDRNPPTFVRVSLEQVGRFVDDLERRYPTVRKTGTD